MGVSGFASKELYCLRTPSPVQRLTQLKSAIVNLIHVLA